MTKEKYEKPVMEVVDLQDDVILTSGCNPDTGCFNDGNQGYEPYPCTYTINNATTTYLLHNC